MRRKPSCGDIFKQWFSFRPWYGLHFIIRVSCFSRGSAQISRGVWRRDISGNKHAASCAAGCAATQLAAIAQVFPSRDEKNSEEIVSIPFYPYFQVGAEECHAVAISAPPVPALPPAMFAQNQRTGSVDVRVLATVVASFACACDDPPNSHGQATLR